MKNVYGGYRRFTAQHRHFRTTLLIFIGLLLTGLTSTYYVQKSKHSQLVMLSGVYSKFLEEKIKNSFYEKTQRLQDFQKMRHIYGQNQTKFWEQYAKTAAEADATVYSQGIISNDYVIINRYPENKAYRKIVTANLTQEAKDLLETHKKLNTIGVSDYMTMLNGKKGYILYIPLYSKNQKPEGFYYMAIEGYLFLNQVVRHDNFSVQMLDHKNLIMNLMNGTELKKYVHINQFEIYHKQVELRVYPTESLIRSLNLLRARHMIVVSIVIAFMISLLYYYLRVAVDRQSIIFLQNTQLANSKRMIALAEMASGVAHEINNPLAILNGKVDMVRGALDMLAPDKDKIKRHLDRMEHVIFRIAKIISSLQKLGYKTHGEDYESVHLKTIVEDALDLYSEKFKNNNINLTVEPIPDKYIKCHPSEINQILSNLLSNSYDAILHCKIKWVQIGFSDIDDYQCIHITDSGNGIPKHIQYKILEPFFTTKATGKGMGIGLSISYSLALQNNGELYLDVKSQNTKFTLKVPTSLDVTDHNADFI